MSRILLLAFFIFLANSFAAPQEKCPARFEKIARTYAEKRTPADKEAFKRYKDNNPEPKTVKLPAPYKGEVGEYEDQVLSLKAGDTVKFGNKTFILGEFLGNGNATHIFALRDFPDRAIRIPFAAKDVDAFGLAEHYQRRWKSAFKGKENIVQLHEMGKLGAYTVVSRVDGSENGMEFMKYLMNKYHLKKPNRWVPKNFSEKFDQEDKEKYEKLRKVASRFFLGRFRIGRGDGQIYYIETRQIVWEPSKNDWIAVDWE